MRIVDPQNATLTNIEVLSHITTNPPRRPPNPPPNSRNWVPSPDLRDHNTVVKEIHNYVGRLAPHLLGYPRYTTATEVQEQGQGQQGQVQRHGGSEVTPMDTALRELVKGLQPFGLTKGEVLMIVNLGVGVQPPPNPAAAEENQEEGGGQNPDEQIHEEGGAEAEGETQANGTGEQMDVDVDGHGVNGIEGEGTAEGEGEGELAEEDYGALALLDTVIEEREERLSNEDVAQILKVIRATLGSKEG